MPEETEVTGFATEKKEGRGVGKNRVNHRGGEQERGEDMIGSGHIESEGLRPSPMGSRTEEGTRRRGVKVLTHRWKLKS